MTSLPPAICESPLNYFAHALPHLSADPPDSYFLAGVAVPDWLGVVARKTKCRTRHAEPYLDDQDPRVASLARGVARHHEDDRWFHESAAFNQLSLEFARRLRDAFGDHSGMRPWFLGHVLVELLLDSSLIAAHPGKLDRYYKAIQRAEPERVAHAIQQMCGRVVDDLAWFIGRYSDVRFLADYADDERLRYRLNQVMKRVRLEELPEKFLKLLPAMRKDVALRCDELMAPSAG